MKKIPLIVISQFLRLVVGSSFILSCVVLNIPPPPPALFFLSVLSIVIVCDAKFDLRNEVGAIVHTISNRVLSNHTVKNIYGNVNYVKTFFQGIIVNDFDGRAPGGRMPSGS